MAHLEDRRISTKKGDDQPTPTGYDGKYPLRVRYRTADGKPRSRCFASERKAKAFMATVEVDRMHGELIDPLHARTLFSDVAKEWLGTVSHLKPKTIAGYESILSHHLIPAFGGARISTIDTTAVKRFVSRLLSQRSYQTAKNTLNVLRSVLATAVESRLIARNPADGVRLDKAKARKARRQRQLDRIYLQPQQIEDLAAAMPGEYRVLVLFAGYVGARAGEIAGLQVRDLDLAGGRVHIRRAAEEVHGAIVMGDPKNGEPRSVPLPKFIIEELRQHVLATGRRGTDWLFQAQRGGQLRHSNFYRRIYQPAAEAAGMPDGLRFHDLRHSCAAMLISKGAHPKAISEWLGHSGIEVTMDSYGGLYESVSESLANSLDELRTETAASWPRPSAVVGL